MEVTNLSLDLSLVLSWMIGVLETVILVSRWRINRRLLTSEQGFLKKVDFFIRTGRPFIYNTSGETLIDFRQEKTLLT